MLTFINCKSIEVENNFKKWNEYLGDKSRSHYSSLDQVNTKNIKVSDLEMAISKKSKAIILAHSLGNPFVYPFNELSYCEFFFHMLFS